MAQQGYPQGQGQPPAYPAAPYGQPPPGQAAPQQVVVTTAPATAVVVAGGNCGACGVGHINEDFTICGIILAILCFPLGLICCFLMKERKCSHCGRTY